MLAAQTPRNLALSKAVLYLFTTLAMVPAGKEAIARASASPVILSVVAEFSKLKDPAFKAYSKECLQVGASSACARSADLRLSEIRLRLCRWLVVDARSSSTTPVYHRRSQI
jgi:hypothetical protein